MRTCPWCENTNQTTIETNGVDPRDPAFTLLCVNRVEPDATSFDHLDYAGKDADQVDDKGLAECGYQWEPNDS